MELIIVIGVMFSIAVYETGYWECDADMQLYTDSDPQYPALVMDVITEDSEFWGLTICVLDRTTHLCFP